MKCTPVTQTKNEEPNTQQVRSILKTKNKREEKLDQSKGRNATHFDNLDPSKNSSKDPQKKPKSNSLRDLFSSGGLVDEAAMDDDLNIIGRTGPTKQSLADNAQSSPQDRLKLDTSPLEMQKNDSRVSMLSKTSMTSSMIARNSFFSLKKTLHPVISTRENKKRKLQALQQLSQYK